MDEQEYYGAPVASDTKPLYERLRDYYEPTDFVTVINIDTAPLRYQFSNPAHEQFVSTAPYHGEIHRTAAPTVITLQPGERKLCPAYEADAMIVTLIKKITTTKTASEITAGRLQDGHTANWTDPQVQLDLIKQIMVSKENLVEKYNQNLNKPTDVEKDLELEDVRPRTRRPNTSE